MSKDTFRAFITLALLLMALMQMVPSLEPLRGAIAALQLAIKIYYA